MIRAIAFVGVGRRIQLLGISTALILLLLAGDVARAADPPLEIESRLELTVDDYLTDSLKGDIRRVIHHPVLQDIAINFDVAWEGSGSGYPTVFRDGELYRMYYRGAQFTVSKEGFKQDHPQISCYAESRDGIHWTKPNLGLFEFEGSKENNIILTGPDSHNFTPFKDANPNALPDERYKALGSEGQTFGLISADGLRWKRIKDTPLIDPSQGGFDSQNLAFWDVTRKEYRIYFRAIRDGRRDIKTATSQDFRQWSASQFLDYPDAPPEELYTNQVQPYYRAPHLLIGLPTRYIDRGWSASMEALPEVDHRRLRSAVQPRYGSALTDTVLMTSRDGRTFRRWNKTFLAPGPERPGAWNYGHLYTAWGMIETAPRIAGMPNELSIYATEGGWTGKESHLRRYTLRIDGFASVQASMSGGEFLTRPFTFSGKELFINFATSAAGSIRIELQDKAGERLLDSPEIFGDSIERVVKWNGNAAVSTLAGKPVRLRFVLKDADLYSLQFR